MGRPRGHRRLPAADGRRERDGASIGVWNTTTGQWEVENVGIAPDLEVEHDPELVRQGKDPQLDKAIEVVMAALSKNPLPAPKRPAYPNYHKK